ncbi:hypothetical protein [Paraburkholderia ginsengiterrae]|nr:hypothetical protein [Paraburkholderia ginsengiterrae]
MTDGLDGVRKQYRATGLVERLKVALPALNRGLRRHVGAGRRMKRLLLNLTTASVLITSAGVSMAQPTPMPTTPITKILAIGTFPPGTDMQLVQHTLPTEVRETAQLYLEGKIDQWYSLQDQPGVVFILNVTDVSQAHEMLEALPLGKAHLMTFSLLPIGPLKPLSKLLNSPSR